MSAETMTHSVGVVFIGRNEGPRLVAALSALQTLPYRRVYVDSMSTDDSVLEARRLGAEVVELDNTHPLSAARGRNVGVDALSKSGQRPQFIQFVDGDTVLAGDWLGRAAEHLHRNPTTAVVCGHLRERFVEQSIFHRLCDMEWAGDVGPIESCGGIFMVRNQAFAEVGGFVAGRIASEEGDLCRRLRRAGWKIERIDCYMGAHDAAMIFWGQWWLRTLRGGYGYAERAAHLRGSPDARHDVTRIASVLVWAIAMPILLAICLMLGFASWMWWLGAVLIAASHAGLVFKIYSRQRRRGRSLADSLLYATFCLLNKYPEACGLIKFLWVKLLRRPTFWIHYKSA